MRHNREVERQKMQHEKKKEDFLIVENENGQCSHLGCFRRSDGRIWKGKLVGSEAVFTLDYTEFVKDTFKKDFLDKCRKEVNRYHVVPTGRSKIPEDELYVKQQVGNTYFTCPRDKCPVILYRQESRDDCVFCGLASALAFFGAHQTGVHINDQRFRKYNKRQTDWQVAHDVMRKNGWVTIAYESRKDTKILAKYPHFNECILMVILCGSDGSVSHSVSICQNYIFDSNRRHALPMLKESLDWCCSAPGISVEFKAYYRAVYFYPRQIKKTHRLPRKIYDYKPWDIIKY